MQIWDISLVVTSYIGQHWIALDFKFFVKMKSVRRSQMNCSVKLGVGLRRCPVSSREQAYADPLCVHMPVLFLAAWLLPAKLRMVPSAWGPELRGSSFFAFTYIC